MTNNPMNPKQNPQLAAAIEKVQRAIEAIPTDTEDEAHVIILALFTFAVSAFEAHSEDDPELRRRAASMLMTAAARLQPPSGN